MTTTVQAPPERASVAKPPSRPPKRAPLPDRPRTTSLVHGLPTVYRNLDAPLGEPDGSFVSRFVAALDDVLAPIIGTLDSLPAYFDPMTAPVHFLDWLAGWVGQELYEKWPPALRRELIAGAVDRHHTRGTKAGIEHVVATFAGAEHVAVRESGGVWELAAAALDDGKSIPEFPDTAPSGCWMKIVVAIGAARKNEVGEVTELVKRVVERVKPAHVRLRDRDVIVVVVS